MGASEASEELPDLPASASLAALRANKKEEGLGAPPPCLCAPLHGLNLAVVPDLFHLFSELDRLWPVRSPSELEPILAPIPVLNSTD